MRQAAKLAGVNKSTISRAIKSGRLSATQDARGALVIDAAELQRVYPPMMQGNGADASKWASAHPANSPAAGALIATLQERAAEQAETIRDLRARLDAADARLELVLRLQPPRRRWRFWRRRE
jgi:DNA-binding LacI/PurR family transcriptional regulator